MVGDGANDCAALKAAHVGVSLSESDASIAAPFTSTAQDITCVPALLREGRAALVTSFQLFRFMALYSIIQFCAVLLCFFRGSVFGNWQYFFQDLVIVFPITILMGATPTAERLTPKRPSGDLLSPRNVASTFGHMLICLGFQLAVYALPFQEPDFVDLQTPAQGPVTWHTTALYYASNLQMLMVAALFARGAPWKAEPHRNSRLFAWFAVCLSISLLLIAVSREGAGTFLWTDDACLPMHLRRLILLLMLLNAIVCFAYETLALPLAELALRSAPPHAATALGVGRHPALTARKPFHALRQAFEAGWSAARGSDRAVEVVTA